MKARADMQMDGSELPHSILPSVGGLFYCLSQWAFIALNCSCSYSADKWLATELVVVVVEMNII